MKRTAILLAALALWCGAAAQQTQPPRFQGADAKRFMARLMGETEKLAIEKQIPASELSPQVVVAFTVDTAGRVDGWRFLDNTCQGRDKCDAEPTRQAEISYAVFCLKKKKKKKKKQSAEAI